MIWLSLSFLGVCLLEGALGYARGAPEAACDNLTPRHGRDPMDLSTAPYRVMVSSDTVKSGERLSVRLSGVDGTEFDGFLVQARNASDDSISGTFFTQFHKYLTCEPGDHNAVTHKSAHHKKEIMVDWEPASGTSGEVRFKAAFVKKFHTFWVGVESPPVRVERSVPGADVPGKPIAGERTRNADSAIPAASPVATFLGSVPRVSEAGSSQVSRGQGGGRNEGVGEGSIYDGCYSSKGCFGSSLECIKDGNCNHTVTWRRKGERILFEVQAKTEGYVAMGLSADTAMGEDAVVECVEEDGRIKAYRSWNLNIPKKSNRRASDHSGVYNVNGAYIDGVMYCSYELDPVFEQNGVKFDLNKQKYVLFVAAGYVKDDKSNVGYHRNGWIAAEGPVALAGTTEQTQQDFGVDTIYDGCNSNKECFGMSGECVVNGDCNHIVAWRKKGERYQFEIQAETDGYVALGLSQDKEMGDDAVVECMEVDGRIKAFRSWNFNTPRKTNRRADVQSGVYNVNGAYVDGVMYCSFEVDPIHEQNGVTFDLNKQKYVLFVAAGYVKDDKSNIGYHRNGWIAAWSPLALAEFRRYDPVLLWLHGFFPTGVRTLHRR